MITNQQKFLLDWGWNEFFEQQIENDPEYEFGKSTLARGVGEEKGRWRIQVSSEISVWSELSGRFRHQVESRIDTPSIGDWIACHLEENQSVALIRKVFTRQTCLYRKSVGSSNEAQILASNVNYAFIVTSANLDFNWARMERYLSIARDSGALPIVLITKAELSQQPQDLVEAVRLEFPGVIVHAVSVMTGMNLIELRNYFVRGKTSVFIGSSGVGKSTLANYLLGEDVLETNFVRESDDRGRHTTTSRYLFHSDTDAMVVDTLGMRSVGLLDQESGLAEQFAVETLPKASKRSPPFGIKN